jgi:hypothetical protein
VNFGVKPSKAACIAFYTILSIAKNGMANPGFLIFQNIIESFFL